MRPSKVILFTKDKCNWCDKAKTLLNSNNISFLSLNIDDSDTVFYIAAFLEFKTMPQCIIDGTYVPGGYEGLVNYLKENK
jgi:glutaredoxin